MRVLVVGATGYLGGAVALRLARDGHAVVALVRDTSKAVAYDPRPASPFAKAPSTTLRN